MRSDICLSSEGRGSLHHFLKSKGWTTSISAGVGDEGLYRSSVAYVFNMSIHLTDSGLEKVNLSLASFNLFIFSMHLTNKPFASSDVCNSCLFSLSKITHFQVYEIIGYIYQFLKLLRQTPPQEWIFKELQDIGNMDFRFVEEQPQDDYATDLAGYLILCSTLDI